MTEQPQLPLILSVAMDRGTGTYSTTTNAQQSPVDLRMLCGALQQVLAQLQEARVQAEVAAAVAGCAEGPPEDEA